MTLAGKHLYLPDCETDTVIPNLCPCCKLTSSANSVCSTACQVQLLSECDTGYFGLLLEDTEPPSSLKSCIHATILRTFSSTLLHNWNHVLKETLSSLPSHQQVQLNTMQQVQCCNQDFCPNPAAQWNSWFSTALHLFLKQDSQMTMAWVTLC